MINSLLAKKSIPLIGIISLGVSIRLFFAFSFNHLFDYFNILVLSKSVADTNSVLEGFFVLKNAIQHESQLFGKIYYQVVALWLHFLDYIKLVDLRYIFDSKAYDPKTPYMSGFTHWGPQHYQITAIKLIQFFYEGIFLYFFLSIIRLIKKNSYSAILIGALFWAINPFIIYPSYVPFQSDLAMTTFLLGGVYFGMKSLLAKEYKITTKNLILMSFCFAVGALMKQVPILFILPFLIILTTSIPSFLLNSAIFAFFYVLISQPFATDTTLMKVFFLTSEESTALFNFTLNNASIAMMSYVVLVIIVFIKRKIIRLNPIHLIQLSLIILSLIYISEDLSYLYAQFNLWIMPFLMLMAFADPLFALMLLVPIFGFYRWITIDNSAMTGSMWLTYGAPLDRIPSFDSIVSKIFQPILFHRMINSLFLIGNGLIIYQSIKNWDLKKKTKIPISIAYIPVILLCIYMAFFLIDFSYRSHFVQITNIKYFDTHDLKLTQKPIYLIIKNPDKRTISGIQIAITQKNIKKNDFVVLETFDKNGHLLSHGEINDFTLPYNFSEINFSFGKLINNERIEVQISKKYGQNEIYIQQADTALTESSIERDYGTYDSFYDRKVIKIKFPKSQYKINILGVYTTKDMYLNIKKHFYDRPNFYFLYIGLTAGLLVFGVATTLFIYRKKIIYEID